MRQIVVEIDNKIRRLKIESPEACPNCHSDKAYTFIRYILDGENLTIYYRCESCKRFFYSENIIDFETNHCRKTGLNPYQP